MDENLVSLLTWKKPIKSTLALVSLNVFLWFLLRQRPLCVISIACLLSYLKHVWTHRIRPEILLDPPDHETWTNLHTYDFQQKLKNYSAKWWNAYVGLRSQSHVSFAAVSILICYALWKIGSTFSLWTLLFIISNGSFAIGPTISLLVPEDETWSAMVDDLLPDDPDIQSKLWSPPPGTTADPEDLSSDSSATTTTTASTAIFNLAAPFFSSVMNPNRSSSPSDTADSDPIAAMKSAGQESLTPYIPRMPDHHEDSEDEFHFDSKHFDSSSSASGTSSASTSFEVINHENDDY